MLEPDILGARDAWTLAMPEADMREMDARYFHTHRAIQGQPRGRLHLVDVPQSPLGATDDRGRQFYDSTIDPQLLALHPTSNQLHTRGSTLRQPQVAPVQHILVPNPPVAAALIAPMLPIPSAAAAPIIPAIPTLPPAIALNNLAAPFPPAGAAPNPPRRRGRQHNYNDAFQLAAPVQTPLPHCEMGARELLTLFPHHTQWPEAGLRLLRNTWTNRDIALAQLHGCGQVSVANCDKREATLRKQSGKNGDAFFQLVPGTFDRKTFANLMTPVAVYDATPYQPRRDINISNPSTLVEIARGVLNWPSGQDAGAVTQAIQWAVANNQVNLTTADIPQMVAQLGFVKPNDANTIDWDQRARTRLRADIQAAGTYV